MGEKYERIGRRELTEVRFAGDGVDGGEAEDNDSVLDGGSSVASSVPSDLGFVIKYPSRPPRPEDIYGFTVYGANRY